MAIAISALATKPTPPNAGLVEIYKSAILELRDISRSTIGSQMKKQHARALLKQATQILRELDDKAAEWIASEVPKAYLRGVRTADAGFGELGLTVRGTTVPLIHQEAVQVLVNELQDDLLDTTTRLQRGFRRLVQRTSLKAAQDRAVTESVARGIVEGKGRRAVAREIAENIVNEYKDKPLIINGRTYNVQSYADMVARTKTAEAQTAGTVNRIVESGHDLAMVTAHGAQDACSLYEGKVVSVSGTSDKYPSIDSLPRGGPPFHPNCKHGMAPFVEPLASGAEKRRAKGIPPSALNTPYNEVEKAHQKRMAA